MAVSHTREGPGWWMDRDGGWNPPELWPESTPPLPGWVLQPNGRWEAPIEVDPHTTEVAPVIDLTETDEPSSSLTPAPLHAAPGPEDADGDELELPKSPHVPMHAAHAGDQSNTSDPDAKPSLNLGFATPTASPEPEPAVEAPAPPQRRWGLVVLGIAVVSALLVVVLLVL